MLRCTRCRESPGPGPTTASDEFKTARSQRDAWHQIEPSRHIAHRDFDQQGSAPLYSRMPRSAMGIDIRGHSPWSLRKREELREEGRSTEFSYREDRHGLQAPSDPISILFLAWSK
jgi:hypothetical protein